MSRSPFLRFALVAATVAIAVATLVDQWQRVEPRVTAMSRWAVVAAFVLGGIPSVACGLQWRALLGIVDVAPPARTAVRVACLAQLGKYLPGSVWPLLVQSELLRPYGIRRERAAVAGVLSFLLLLPTGGAIAAVLLAFSPDLHTDERAGAVIVAAVLFCCLHPRLLNAAADRLLRVCRQPPLAQRISFRDGARTTGFGSITVLALGLHALVLTRQFGPVSPATAMGGFLLAWVAGLALPFLPAGLGVRDAILYVTLGRSLGHTDALAMVAVSRLLLIAVDLVVAAVAAISWRVSRQAAGSWCAACACAPCACWPVPDAPSTRLESPA